MARKWNIGARDEELPPPRPVVGRLVRAQANFFETFPIFIAAVILVLRPVATGPADRWTGARRLALARRPGRLSAALRVGRAGGPDLAWIVSVVGIVLMMWPALKLLF